MNIRAGVIAALAMAVFGGPSLGQEVITQDVLDSADLAKGRIMFLRCRSCHSLGEDERDKQGPNLWGVFGRQVATREGYEYSPEMKAETFVWTPDKLNQWLAKPSEFVPGNDMAFVGLNREQDRINLIAYLMKETGGQTTAGDDATPDGDAETPADEAPAEEPAGGEPIGNEAAPGEESPAPQ